MKSIYEKLEFDKVKKELIKYAHCELAINYIANLKIFSEQNLKIELSELEDAMKYASKYKGINVYNIKNIMSDLALLVKEGTANIDFFSVVSTMLENVSQIKKDFIADDSFQKINGLIYELKNLESLKNRIDSVISKDLSIYDNASSNLASIRFQIKKEESSQTKIISTLMNKYRNYLNDERMALKNHGLTLPIKVTYKNRVEGVVVDTSSSGNTCFIMPLEILLSNNKIVLLKEQEQQEIIRILKDLANVASKNVDDLRKNLFLLAHIDYLFAKVAYAFDLKANIARIDSFLKIENGRHPLIPFERVIGNSFYLDKQRIMLITGPNAGGKTVALKTVGLLVLMHQCGLAIPCDDARIPYFENIFIDIGDEQSLTDNLSTFTSHMQALKNAIINVNDKSLVLIDELGSGTSPLDGEALAIGVLKYLHDLNSYAIVSSHFDGLKSYALNNDYILNASMIFDEEKLVPTYRIRLGVAGKSYGLEVAEREGIPLTIIKNAKEYISEKKQSLHEEKADLLNKKLLDVETLKMDLESKNKEMEQIIALKNNELQKIKLEKQKLTDNFEEEKERLFLKAKQEVDEMMNEFKTKKDVKMHEVIDLKRKIDDKIQSDEEEQNNEHEDFKINDRVVYVPSGLKGFLKEINKNKGVINLDNGLTIKVDLCDLKHVVINNNVKRIKQDLFVTKHISNISVPLECNVIGFYVKEAIDAVDKYLDDARKVKYHRVRIVHGNGTGKLRQAIHEYLKKKSFVESYGFATYNEGGTGATVVNLK